MKAAGEAGRSPSPPVKRRMLGDAWQDWDPACTACPAETHAGPGPFMLFETLLALLAAVAWGFLVWMAEPRLLSLGLPQRLLIVVRLAGAGLPLLPILLLGSIWIRLPVPVIVARTLELWVVFTWGTAEMIGLRLGASRDRLGHSFVKVVNRLSWSARRARPGHSLLLLAPRCLRPDLMRELRALGAAAGAQVVVATGGEEARTAVQTACPAAVLAVACERDLVAGIRDVLPHATVLGLANRRPEGPCRNSEVDMAEAKRQLTALKGLVAWP